MSLMDMVRAVNDANLILPAGDVQIGPPRLQHLHQQPVDHHPGDRPASPQDRGSKSRFAWRTSAAPNDASQIQTNIVRVDGQRSVYTPMMKQGGDTNTIEVVNGIREALGHLFDIPEAW